MAPDVTHELKLRAAGYHSIAGIDEAGRGCWAGPVVAAAVVLPASVLEQPTLLTGIDDSKKLTEAQREDGYALITRTAIGVGVGAVPAHVIDSIGIVPATRLAMTIAMLALPCLPDALLIDALTLEPLSLLQYKLIKGDAHCLSIAAASIIAKVTRDHLMHTADRAYPGYHFARHKGYGTAVHRHALDTLGISPIHRLSYRPVALRQYNNG
jgi:ribonuclease HII